MNQLPDVTGDSVFVVARKGSRGVTQTSEIWRDHAVVLGKGWHDMTPLIPGLGKPVQQH